MNTRARRLKIAIDLKDASLHGAGKGRYAYELAHALIESAPHHDWVLYTRPHKRKEIEKWSKKNVTVRSLKAPGILWHWALKRALLKDRTDHFIAPTSYVTAALNPSVKTTLVVHDLIAFLFPNDHHRWAGFVERNTLSSALKNAQNIVCVSGHTQTDLIQLFPEAKAKKMTIATPAFVSTLVSSPVSTSKESYLLMVGTLEPRKNHRLIFKIFPQLSRVFPELKLKWVGAKGWDHAKVMQDFPSELKNKMEDCGRVDDAKLANLYQNAEALIYPSLYEGFGMPVLEAMTLGCPVVCSNRASLPEVVGTAALVRDPSQPEMWISTIIELLSSAHLRKNLIQEGHARAAQFSWKKSAENVLKLLS